MSPSTKRRLSAICNCCNTPFAATGVSRRQFLAGGVAAFAATSLPAQVFAQAKPHRIDVHHHVVPPGWLNAMNIIGRSNPPLLNWSVQKTLDDMDKGAVEIAMLSPTAPQVAPLGKGVGVNIAREANEYSKKLMADHPGRFGIFATLPLPHVDEIARRNRLRLRHAPGRRCRHADELRRQVARPPVPQPGLGGAQSAQGDRLYAPRRRQLLRQPGPRLAGVGDRVGNRLDPQHREPDLQRHLTEVQGHQLDLLARRRRPDVVRRTLPGANDERAALQGQVHPRAVQAELNRFHYDTAQVTMAGTLGALAKLVPVSQIVYGTDFPYRTAADHSKGVASIFSGDHRQVEARAEPDDRAHDRGRLRVVLDIGDEGRSILILSNGNDCR